jgi:hypothetical protein
MNASSQVLAKGEQDQIPVEVSFLYNRFYEQLQRGRADGWYCFFEDRACCIHTNGVTLI